MEEIMHNIPHIRPTLKTSKIFSLQFYLDGGSTASKELVIRRIAMVDEGTSPIRLNMNREAGDRLAGDLTLSIR